jgi:hypothetical protein
MFKSKKEFNKFIKQLRKKAEENLKQYENHPEFAEQFPKGEKKQKRAFASTRKDKKMEK